MNYQCENFVSRDKDNENPSSWFSRNACLKCGRTEEAHAKVTQQPEIHIVWGGKIHIFKSNQEALDEGFHLY